MADMVARVAAAMGLDPVADRDIVGLSVALNTELDGIDALQDEVKAYFRAWFEKNFDPVRLMNDAEGHLAELQTRAVAEFQRVFLPRIDKSASAFGRGLAAGAQK